MNHLTGVVWLLDTSEKALRLPVRTTIKFAWQILLCNPHYYTDIFGSSGLVLPCCSCVITWPSLDIGYGNWIRKLVSYKNNINGRKCKNFCLWILEDTRNLLLLMSRVVVHVQECGIAGSLHTYPYSAIRHCQTSGSCCVFGSQQS
jgi:hypothetical protein